MAIDEVEIDRRTLVRILIVVGVGVPILIEGVTFLGLVSHSLDGGGGETTPTQTRANVGVGDDLLPTTPESETVTVASVTAGDDAWRFRLSVRVNNTGSGTYGLTLTEVRTNGGEVVSGGSGTGTLAAGETGTVTGAWSLSAGDRPVGVSVRTTRNGSQAGSYDVGLAPIPVSG